jgi:hypothetical protein
VPRSSPRVGRLSRRRRRPWRGRYSE